jgi:hypothetical protein
VVDQPRGLLRAIKARMVSPALVGLGARPGAARGRSDPRRLLLRGRRSAERSK